VQAPGFVKERKKNPKLDPFVIGLHGVANFHFLGVFFSFVENGWRWGAGFVVLGNLLTMVVEFIILVF
jgi:hypothetical protein